MMVRVASGHFPAGNVNLGGIAEAFAFVPWKGQERFLFPELPAWRGKTPERKRLEGFPIRRCPGKTAGHICRLNLKEWRMTL